MLKLEFIERLSRDSEEQRWLVRVEGHAVPRVAWMFHDEDRERVELIEQDTRPWLGPLHARVSQIFELARRGESLTFVVDDDRGPPFPKAAAQLTDPIERERWSVAQIIAITSALAAMRRRAPGFVHRHLEPSKIFVDAAGHARLRAPIATVTQGPRPSYMGRGRVTRGLTWLSPEQCRGYPLTAASDVFSLAANLFAALSGQSPFRRDTEFGTLQAIVTDAPPPLVTHAPGLAAVLARAFQKDPAQRHPDPEAFAGELLRCVPDAADYDECVSDRIVAWWPTATPARLPPVLPAERCRMAWDQLHPTGSADVRHCAACSQDVVRVTSLAAIVSLGGRRCISYPGND
ncbi:MAG TPA: protein kinase [Kofleriaceae bacterium]|nr:protein kinase [Kofleriaceae bacterium]